MESTAGRRRGEPRRGPARRAQWHARDAPDVDPASIRLPAGFQWGVGSAAHQVEGGTVANQWSLWELATRPDGSPTILTGERCGRAVDHWGMFDTDLALLRQLGVDLYRFSVEWSRVEPLPGHVDDAALDAYRARCAALRAAGIAPLVTLHHFTEPAWAAERGGFGDPGTVAAWLRFVQRCVERLGDLVDQWVTINEPVPFVVQGWIRGEWPPGRRDPRQAAVILEHLLLAHAAAYALIHAADLPGRVHRVGLAHHVMPLQPERRWDPWNRSVARVLDRSSNDAVPEALGTGVLRLRMPGLRRVVRHPVLCGTQDFFGVNHYHAALVRMRPSPSGPVDIVPSPGEPDDLGWARDPATLGQVLRWAGGFGLPVLVTENGMVDGDVPDLRRRRYLGACLAEVAAAVADGVDVTGYVHWSLTDAFEWSHGFSAQTGLYRVDRRDLRRLPTTTAEYYRAVIAAHRPSPAPER